MAQAQDMHTISVLTPSNILCTIILHNIDLGHFFVPDEKRPITLSLYMYLIVKQILANWCSRDTSLLSRVLTRGFGPKVHPMVLP